MKFYFGFVFVEIIKIDLLVIIDLIVDLMFIVDILINFWIMYLYSGEVVMDL